MEENKPIPEQSYSEACCRGMQVAAQEDLVDYLSRDEIYLEKTYEIDEGDGYTSTLTEKSVKLTYCPFCGKTLIYSLE